MATADQSDASFYNLTVDEVYQELGTSETGLAPDEAASRLLKFGPNEISEVEGKSLLSLFLDQFKDFLIIILLLAAIISFVIGGIELLFFRDPTVPLGLADLESIIDTFAILAIVLAAAVLGFIQEFRAEKAIEALKQMAAPSSSVIRDGKEVEIPARELVPGDVVILREGDKIPADIRLTEGFNVKSNEAALTGESVPVVKKIDAFLGKCLRG